MVAKFVLPIVVKVFKYVLPVEVASVQNKFVIQPVVAVNKFVQNEPVVVALVNVELTLVKLEIVVVAKVVFPETFKAVDVTPLKLKLPLLSEIGI